MAQQIKKQQEEQVETNNTTSFEEFIKKYQKILGWAVIIVLLIVFGSLAYAKWIAAPQKEEAKSQMFNAEQMFRAGNFETALNGDGNIMGFAQVAREYGNKAGKAVNFYAGLCELNLGNSDEALSYFKKYKTSDKIMKGRVLCCIGDAYANKGENAQALSYFKKAAAVDADNAFNAGYLLKAGIICEEMGDKDQALKFYKEIELNYPQTPEGADIAKYISRISAE